MTIEALKFFNTSEGEALLQEYSNMTPKELDSLAMRLAKRKLLFSAELITLLKLRYKAVAKFRRANSMFFTTEGLEQAGEEKISQYIAQRFLRALPSQTKIADLTCGIGGNTISLAQHFKVLAIDCDAIHIECAKHNTNIYSVNENIEFRLGRSEDNIMPANGFFIDPQRLRAGQTKTRSLLNSSPNVFKILPQILKQTENICIKISPAFDYKEIKELPLEPEIEVISEKNTNKAALLWFGKFKSCNRRATIFLDDEIVSFIDEPPTKEIAIIPYPLKYIYEPDKAIIKAHLIDEIAEKYDLQKINPMIGLLTSENYIQDTRELFRIFEVIETQKFSLKNLKKLLSKKKINRAHIMPKRFPENPDLIRSKLKLKEGGEYAIILTALADDKYYFILTKYITAISLS